MELPAKCALSDACVGYGLGEIQQTKKVALSKGSGIHFMLWSVKE